MKLELEIQSDALTDTAADTEYVLTIKEIILVTKHIKRHKSPRLS